MMNSRCEFKKYPYILKNVKKYADEIVMLQEMAEDNTFNEILDSITYIKAQNLTGMPKGNSISDPTGNAAIKRCTWLESKVTQYEEKIINLLKLRDNIDEWLETLEEKEQELINLRFFEDYKIELVTKKLNICKNTYFQWEKMLIDSYENFMGDIR